MYSLKTNPPFNESLRFGAYARTASDVKTLWCSFLDTFANLSKSKKPLLYFALLSPLYNGNTNDNGCIKSGAIFFKIFLSLADSLTILISPFAKYRIPPWINLAERLDVP